MIFNAIIKVKTSELANYYLGEFVEEEKEVEQVQDDTNKELQEENNAETEQQNDAKQEEQPNTVSEAQDVANKAEQNLEDKKDKLIKIIRLISDIIFVPFFAIIIISSIIMLSVV